MTKIILVGTGCCEISRDPEAVLAAYGLGSCIALALYDSQARIGGLLHIVLPESAIDPAKASRNPYAFADTAVPLMLDRMRQAGACKKRVTGRAAGGARMIGGPESFDVGKRNYLALRKALRKCGLLLDAESTGGRQSRNFRMEIATGRAWVRTAGAAEQELISLTRRRIVASCHPGAE